MAKRRLLDAEHPAYDASVCGADGRAQCRRCLGPLPHPQAMFCGAPCAHEFRIRASPAYARRAVFARDGGVCTHCRLDCGMLDRIIARLRRGSGDADPAGGSDAQGEWTAVERTDDEQRESELTALWLIEKLGLGRRRHSCSLWQMDHRVPFSDGGADCGLGNYRTLCLACHRLQTRELHRRLSTRRRDRGGNDGVVGLGARPAR
ncbi:MAG: HNH endonuclease [Planctomycetes bacterium]|nr:HNH endonuclease [Planctomycetota bacterium]